ERRLDQPPADPLSAPRRQQAHAERAAVRAGLALLADDVAPADDLLARQHHEVRIALGEVVGDEGASGLDGRRAQQREVAALAGDAVDGAPEAWNVLVRDGEDGYRGHGFSWHGERQSTSLRRHGTRSAPPRLPRRPRRPPPAGPGRRPALRRGRAG